MLFNGQSRAILRDFHVSGPQNRRRFLVTNANQQNGRIFCEFTGGTGSDIDCYVNGVEDTNLLKPGDLSPVRITVYL